MGFNMDEVVGALDLVDDDEDVLGDLMGYDEQGDDELVGALKRNPMQLARLLRKVKGRFLRIPPKPSWRDQIAPGVNTPGVGLWPLPLTPLANDGVLDAANGQIEWRGTPQKPFRGERIVIVTNRSALALNQVRIAAVTVGTTPQLADIGELAVEAFAPDAFGVRLKLDQATPGVLYRIIIRAVGAIPAGETIAISPQVLGHVVRS